VHDVIVIGGGIAGLSCAWKLHATGLDVLVLEAQPQAGGNIRTEEHAGYRLELGPYSVMGGSETLWQLVEELDIEKLAVPSEAAADNRFIYRDGELLPLPLSLGGFFGTKLLSTRAKLRLMAEPFIRNGAQPDDTAWQFFVRRFGEEAATYVMGPFVSGIYAGDPKLLGARAAFPKFYDFERKSGSMIGGSIKYMLAKRRRMKREGIRSRKGLYSFDGGLGRLTGEIADRLVEHVITGAPVESVRREGDDYLVEAGSARYQSRAVVCAVPPAAASKILGTLAPGVVAPMVAIPMSPVTLIHWSQPAGGERIPPGFGFLMPRHYGLRVLGTVFASQLFPGRAPEGQVLLSSFYGGMLDRKFMELDDDRAVDVLLQEHRQILGAIEQPEMVRIYRYPGAIPQLLPDHPERIAEIYRCLDEHPGIVLAGNYQTGVGVEHAVASGYNAYAKVTGFLAEQHAGSMERARA
jgi:oxygen-dependent protoporphyrinogen oxidase